MLTPGTKAMMACLALYAPAATLTGCGLQASSADLFVLTRTGQGPKLTLLVNDGGTVSCNGRAPAALPDNLLLTARHLVTQLTQDAQRKLAIPPTPGGAYSFTVRLSAGTVAFGDTAAAGHPELAQAELFAVTAARAPCGLPSG